ncbi:coatamer/Adaptin N terminal region family protein [Babesia bovis T2Bo]|uniref:Coatomer subunit beta n=1 Tax=Babesia bovis TaxID=5865 RepID=A7AS75_BABBO|nr:coatamer/Adaptin N terminal region family protein [Babesia bovis T2Bo]EDO07394.1 coatamer/Adaptin N terminal region family protein [Babesia bovis T2Bo]|eukprot:XP_001610962.1 coatamer beta subunit [Babesia bovis T2Bo]
MAIGQLISESETPCPIFWDIGATSDRSIAWIRSKLEETSTSKKKEALELTITNLLNGEDVSSLLMTIIRFVLPSTDHGLKKLVHLFLQIFDFCSPDGTLREESILVCNALLNDLNSSNEYVRGSTLRLVSKLRHWSIVSPLITGVVDNLRHGEPYVHRNALMCLAKIAERFGTESVISGMEETENLLLGNTAVSVKVQAFNLLVVCQPTLAVQYLMNVEGSLLGLAPRFHLEILTSFTTLCALNTEVRTFMMRLVVMILENSEDNAVRMEGGIVVCQLKSTPIEARRAAASALTKLLLDESDLNVKMLVLSKLNTLHARSSAVGDAPNVLEPYVMDIVHALRGSSTKVNLGLLSLALRSLSRQNVDLLLQSFKKAFIGAEDIGTYSQQQVADYRIMLIKGIHYTCGRYPDRSAVVYDMLLGYLVHTHQQTAEDCALFFKQLTELLPNLRESTIVKLLTFLESIPHANVLSVCFWVIGEYAESAKLAQRCCNQIYNALLPFPFVVDSVETDTKDSSLADDFGSMSIGDGSTTTQTVVLEDGTYGAQLRGETTRTPQTTTLRGLLVSKCDPLLYCSIAQCLLKLSYASGESSIVAKAALVIVNLLRLMQDPQYVNVYSQRRMRTILRLCLGYLKDRDHFRPLLEEYILASRLKWNTSSTTERVDLIGHVDDPISFATFFGSDADDQWAFDDETDDQELIDVDDHEIDKILSTSNSISSIAVKESNKRDLSNVHQFTSLMDPLYIEASVAVIATRIYLTLYLRNTTDILLQNIRVMLFVVNNRDVATAQPIITLESGGSSVLQLNIKLKRSENDNIYGHVYFDKEKSGIQECLSFNPMDVWLYDYVTPSFITLDSFRSSWDAAEWEERLDLHQSDMDPVELLRDILQVTHMTVVGSTPPPGLKWSPGNAGQKEFVSHYMNHLSKSSEFSAIFGDSSFFAVNLYCKTLHDDEALANLSVVKQSNGLLTGSLNIRCDYQEVCTSLCDYILKNISTFNL